MKKILSLALSITMLLSITSGLNLTAYAADASTDFEYVMVDDNSVRITGYLGDDINVVIPPEIDGYAVTEIENFYVSENYVCEYIWWIEIPDSVTTIAEYAFDGLIGLNRVTIGNSVVNVGEGAFSGCSSLQFVKFGSSMEYLSSGMFKDCTSLRRLSLPKNIGYIYSDSLPEKMSVLYILNDDCVIEPNAIPYMATICGYLGSTAEKYANYYGINFKYICDDYVYILLEDGTAEITEYLGTEQYLEIPSELNGITVTSIADDAIIANKRDIAIPDSITKIGSNAFQQCNRISFGNNVKTFGNNAIMILNNNNLEINYNGSYDDWMNCDIINDSFIFGVQSLVFANGGYRLNLNGKPLTEIDYNSNVDIMRFATCSSIERIMITSSTLSSDEINSLSLFTSLLPLFPNSSVSHLYDVWILNPDTVFESNFDNPKNVRFVGYSGSTVEKYANENGIPFVAISDAIADMEYSGASVTLQDDLSLNFKAPKSAVDSVLAEENVSAVYATFDVNGKETKVDMPTVSGESYSFTCPDIAPNMMNDVVNAKLYATIDGADICVDTASYSVADYCYAMLDKTDDAELKTLLVDMLNYGADSQAYTSYETDKLANANLTDEQKSFGTQEEPALNSILDTEYEAIDNPSTEWLGAGLRLDENISMRFKLSADDITNLSVKVASESGEWTIPSAEFVPTNGGYYVYFDGFNAGQLSEAVYVTVYDGDTAVSNTLRYSIETYAAMAQSTENEALKCLTNSMMKYGNSAYAYIH